MSSWRLQAGGRTGIALHSRRPDRRAVCDATARSTGSRIAEKPISARLALEAGHGDATHEVALAEEVGHDHRQRHQDRGSHQEVIARQAALAGAGPYIADADAQRVALQRV